MVVFGHNFPQTVSKEVAHTTKDVQEPYFGNSLIPLRKVMDQTTPEDSVAKDTGVRERDPLVQFKLVPQLTVGTRILRV